jgi:hypothetical protein
MIGSNRKRMIAGLATVLAAAGVFKMLASAAEAPAEEKSPIEFTADGKLKQPEGYRKWVYVGTPLTPNELNGGEAPFPDFHAVYIDPESYAEYAKTGKFRDGTVMVKELVAVGAKEASSGKGYFMGDFIGLETSIKDSTSVLATSTRSKKRPLRKGQRLATHVMRAMQKKISYSRNITLSCVQQPRTRSEVQIAASY